MKSVYVKDVPNGQLRHIRLENNENKPVTNSRDTQEVPPEKGKLVLKTIHGYKHTTSVFDDFRTCGKRPKPIPPPLRDKTTFYLSLKEKVDLSNLLFVFSPLQT